MAYLTATWLCANIEMFIRFAPGASSCEGSFEKIGSSTITKTMSSDLNKYSGLVYLNFAQAGVQTQDLLLIFVFSTTEPKQLHSMFLLENRLQE
jgi:hypothetical protein